MKNFLKVLAILFILSSVSLFFSIDSEINILDYGIDDSNLYYVATSNLIWNISILATICVVASIILFALSIIVKKIEDIEDIANNSYNLNKKFSKSPELPTSNICPKCGAYNPYSSYHCSSCGNALRK